MSHAWIKFVAVAVISGTVHTSYGQCSGTEEQELGASDGAWDDRFGGSVAVDGAVAVVGASHHLVNGFKTGAAYVFRDNGSQWSETDKLTASDGADRDDFGQAVAIAGDVALVGAPSDDDWPGSGSGSAYVYRYNGSVWIEEQKLTANVGVVSGAFGTSVALSGDVAVVGAPGADNGAVQAGGVYVFRYDGFQWLEEQKLTASDGAQSDGLGASVALSGSAVVAGARNAEHDGLGTGAAYVFRFDGVQWLEDQKLTASDGEDRDFFGMSVAVGDDVAVVGSMQDSDHGSLSGSAYVFGHDGIQWVQRQKLTPSDAEAFDLFGVSVSLSEDTLVVGANENGGGGPGSAYVYRWEGTKLVELRKLLPSDGVILDQFGDSVAVSGDTVMVGAPGHDGAAQDSGAAYAFRGAELALDVTPETVLPGDLLTITTCGGQVGGAVLLAAVELNTSALFVVLSIGLFDAAGQRELSLVVPAGLAGNTVTLQSVGFYSPGQAGPSNRAAVEFQ